MNIVKWWLLKWCLLDFWGESTNLMREGRQLPQAPTWPCARLGYVIFLLLRSCTLSLARIAGSWMTAKVFVITFAATAFVCLFLSLADAGSYFKYFLYSLYIFTFLYIGLHCVRSICVILLLFCELLLTRWIKLFFASRAFYPIVLPRSMRGCIVIIMSSVCLYCLWRGLLWLHDTSGSKSVWIGNSVNRKFPLGRRFYDFIPSNCPRWKFRHFHLFITSRYLDHVIILFMLRLT